MPVLDQRARPLRSLRLSVTDRCNLRCAYCMPEAEYLWLPRRDLLDFEEISRLVDVFLALGVDRFRLTGGEPLLRRDLPTLVEMLARKPGISDLALTTNGIMLADLAEPLRRAGLMRITISLDTLSPDRFHALTRRDLHAEVLRGIAAAAAAGFPSIKLDTVVIRGVNDDEIGDLLGFAQSRGAEIRFIEYMDVGGATRWRAEDVVSRSELLTRIHQRCGAPQPLHDRASAPAERFRLPSGQVFGIIPSTTAPFCAACDRSRLTADGMWYRCLYATSGLSLRDALRSGASDQELLRLLGDAWRQRTDQGAVDRLGLAARGASLSSAALRADPHLEMHTRGG